MSTITSSGSPSGRPVLSILTPAVPSRMSQIAKLCNEIARQIGDQPVEHMVFLDNKRRTVGEKRDALLRAARGKYVAFVDDDDEVSPDYVASLLSAAQSDPDVITFRQHAVWNGQESEIEFRLGNPNQSFNPCGVTKRNAWHICAWRRSLAICSSFPPTNYGEDWEFASQLCAIPNLIESHIDKVLHVYRHDQTTTEAPPPVG